MGEAAWSAADGHLLIKTHISKSVLGMLFTSAAEKITRDTLRGNGAGALKLSILPGEASANTAPKKARPARAGSAQARAMEHPMVQQAQRLFNAEVRNIVDLRDKD